MEFVILSMNKAEILAQLNEELGNLDAPLLTDITDGQCRAFVANYREHYNGLGEYTTVEDWETEEIFMVRRFLVTMGALPDDGTYEDQP